MIKNMNPTVPAALCLAFAAGLTACKDTDVSTTAQASGSAAEAAAPSAAGERQQTREAAARSTQPTPTDPAAREAAAREARALRAQAAREQGDTAPPRGRDEAAIVAAREARIRDADRAASREASSREPVVLASPAVLDFGDMATGEQRTAPVTLTNSSDTVIRLVDARTTCGCTVANVPRDHDMQPGESIEVDVSLRAGGTATRLSKRVNFLFEDHPVVSVEVASDVIAYVTYEPRVLDPESNSDGRIVVRSHDGTPFHVVGVTPLIVADLPEEAATEHELFVVWDQWSELRQPRRLEISIDHPKMEKVTAAIRSPVRAVTADERTLSRELTQDDRRVRPVRQVDLHELAHRGDLAAVLERINKGEDVDSTDPRGMSLLGVAARHGHVELMQTLLDAGADVNYVSGTDGLTPLMNAAQSKNAETVRALLDAGADVNARDFTLGNTALSWAALSGDAETVKVLLDAGAIVEVVARITGYTPLTWAAGFGETGSVKLLLEAGADREIACQVQGATPVMYAAMAGRVDNLKVLLDAGVDLEAKDNRGRTVLVFAAGHSGADAETISTLIEGGADVHAVDARGMNALDHARTRGDGRRDEIVAVLQPHFDD